MGKNYSKVAIILKVNNEWGCSRNMNGEKTPIPFYIVLHILYSTLLRRNISSKVEPSFLEDIEMATGFGGVQCDYVWW